MPEMNIREIRVSSSLYPCLLKEIGSPPDPLYISGEVSLDLFQNSLAVVGSRAMSMYGEWVVKNIVRELACAGITIVSGFMYGVDALSHRVALDAGGKTVAVMAGSIVSVYPTYQTDLYNEILYKGVLVSEYREPGHEAPWMFARRNRIVAGLCKAALVVEAGENSGSLITAAYAKKFGRKIFCPPGNINLPNSFGTLKLIKEGATMITEAEDILKFYFGPKNKRIIDRSAGNRRLKEGSLFENEPEYRPAPGILQALKLEPLSADELAVKLKISPSKVLKELTGLELDGFLVERNGKYYVS